MEPSLSKPSDASLAPVALEAVRDQLRRTLASAAFGESERLRSLLSFLIEQTILGHAAEIKESVVAVEVFGREAGFDPRSDSLVRVQVRNLRRKLDEYYAGEGRHDPVLIRLPKGTYVPVFQLLAADAAASPDSEPLTPAPRPRTRQVWWMVAAGLAVTALAAGLSWLAAGGGESERGSLVVLPFANVGGGAETEYLADGFADELMSVLGTRPGLRVAARSSAFQFKGKQPDARAVARQLRVRSVVEGSIQPQGGRLKVTAQLIDERSGVAVWSQRFDCERGESAAVLDGIARAVAASLKVAAPARPAHLPAPEVQELYLRGLYLWGRRDAESRRRGLECLGQAAARDPAYAPALGAFALACASRCYHAFPPRQAWAEKARENARKALAADDATAKAHCALAWVDWIYDRNWPAAEESFHRALQVDPNYAGAHNLLALGLTTRGRFDEAIREAKRARELDPIAFMVSTDLALVNLFARRFGDAEALARSLLAMDKGFDPGHFVLGECLAANKRYAAAMREFDSIEPPYDAEVFGHRGYVMARSGNRAGALAAATSISPDEGSGGDPCNSLALIYTGLGDRDKAFEWLNKAVDRRETSVMFAGVDPFLDELRSDPRFPALRRRLGL